jgi:hypothetical protein
LSHGQLTMAWPRRVLSLERPGVSGFIPSNDLASPRPRSWLWGQLHSCALGRPYPWVANGQSQGGACCAVTSRPTDNLVRAWAKLARAASISRGISHRSPTCYILRRSIFSWNELKASVLNHCSFLFILDITRPPSNEIFPPSTSYINSTVQLTSTKSNRQTSCRLGISSPVPHHGTTHPP